MGNARTLKTRHANRSMILSLSLKAVLLEPKIKGSNRTQFVVWQLPVHFAHRNHNWLEKSAQSKLFLCEAEIRLFRRYLYDRNQFVKNSRETELLRTESELVNTNRDKPLGVEIG